MRDGFVIHEKTMRMVRHLPYEDIGFFWNSLVTFYETGEINIEEIAETSPAVAIVLEDACERMRADAEAYEQLAQKRSEAGKAGAQKRWQNDDKAMANDSNAIANDSKAMANDSNDMATDGDSVSVSVLKENSSDTSYLQSKRKVALPSADCEALILNDGSEWKPTVNEFEEYKRLYPSVNVEQEFRNMRGWCSGNPTKRKTPSGVKRFVTSWLSREQNKGHPPEKPKKTYGVEPRAYEFDDFEARLMRAQA